MRQRAVLLFLICVFLTALFLILLPGRRRNSINHIVKETQEKISVLGGQLINQEEDGTDQELDPDPVYLSQLGLVGHNWPKLHPKGPWLVSGKVSQPCLVTGVEPGQAEFGLGLVKSVQHYLPDTSLLVYDLGISKYENELISKICNTSTCFILNFDFDLWPSHVKDLKLHAYRPIIIQSTLRDVGSVVWLDVDYRLTESDLSPWLEQARDSGVVAWQHEAGTVAHETGGTSEEPGRGPTATTSLTHPRMFEFFPGINYEDYAFQHMASCSSLVFLYTARLHSELMLPWLKCVLTEACINPIGAQDTGCRFDKKPQYRYSGCHRYDMSAFNIVLGSMFSFQENCYMRSGGPWDQTFFRKVNQDSSLDLVVTDQGFNQTSSSMDRLNRL